MHLKYSSLPLSKWPPTCNKQFTHPPSETFSQSHFWTHWYIKMRNFPNIKTKEICAINISSPFSYFSFLGGLRDLWWPVILWQPTVSWSSFPRSLQNPRLSLHYSIFHRHLWWGPSSLWFSWQPITQESIGTSVEARWWGRAEYWQNNTRKRWKSYFFSRFNYVLVFPLYSGWMNLISWSLRQKELREDEGGNKERRRRGEKERTINRESVNSKQSSTSSE